LLSLYLGAASYEAAKVRKLPIPTVHRLLIFIIITNKAYEQHCDENGHPQSHEKAKELLYVSSLLPLDYLHLSTNSHSAGFTGAFVDREFETHGLDVSFISIIETNFNPDLSFPVHRQGESQASCKETSRAGSC
jgi:hypothetical protein